MGREKTQSWGGLNRSRTDAGAKHREASPSQKFFGQSRDDGEELPPGSPGTPPKKIWEQKYRSFLHRKRGADNASSRSSSSSVSSLDSRTLIPPRKNGNHATPVAVPSALQSNNNSRKETPPKYQQSDNNRGNSRSPSGGGEDSSIRGGNLFSHIFRRDQPSGNQRSVSADELDGTMRRGVDKAYSPKHSPRDTIPTHAPRSGAAVHPFVPPRVAIPLASAGSHVSVSNSSLYRASSTGHCLSPSSVQIHEAAAFGFSRSGEPPDKLQQNCSEDDDEDIPIGLRTPPLSVSEPAMPLPMMPQHPTSITSIEEPNDEDTEGIDLSQRKKAFTEFHNSNESYSPFLGDDHSSVQFQAAALWAQTPKHKITTSHHISHGEFSQQQSPILETVPENIEITKQRMLRAFLGVDKWKPGRRYLIAPAALAACSLDDSSSAVLFNSRGSNATLTATQAATLDVMTGGSTVLGKCLLSYSMTGNSSVTAKTWSRASLVLRQNFLLEFDENFQYKGEPRGYAHLEGAIARPHPDFADAVELDFFGSPCSKADRRTLVIRLNERVERDAWVTCLNRASAMDVSDLYELDDSDTPLGDGYYSTVRQARVRSSGEAVAVKIFDKNSFWKLVVKGQERADALVRETSVQAMLTAKCTHVSSFLRLRGFFETSKQVVLELELLGGTDLFRYISSKQGAIAESEAAHILADILNCLLSMNSIGVAHRDIKPANVLMCNSRVAEENSDVPPCVKVCDFGMSTFVGVDGQVRGRCGTPGYVAPEIFTTGLHGGYGNKVDVYSVGVTLYVMLCGYEPFYGETDDELVEANRKSNVDFPNEEWKSVSADARDLVELLMEKDPNKRPSAREALDHRWFKRHLGTTPRALSGVGNFVVSHEDNCVII